MYVYDICITIPYLLIYSILYMVYIMIYIFISAYLALFIFLRDICPFTYGIILNETNFWKAIDSYLESGMFFL